MIEGSFNATGRGAHPSLLIGGAPKCATSTLFGILAKHPHIVASQPKETFFLADADYPIQPMGEAYRQAGQPGYERFFAKDKVGRWMDGSTHYLFQKTPREFLENVATKCVACFMLREPAERMHSSFVFAQQNKTHIKPGLSFRRYVDHLLGGQMQSLRGYFTSEEIFQIFCRELDNSCYVDHLGAWRGSIGEDRLLVFRFEDFVVDPGIVVSNICDALQIDSFDDVPALMKREKPTSVSRSWRVHRIARRLAVSVPSDWKLKAHLRRIYKTLQGSGGRTVDADTVGALDQLRDYFVDPNQRLADGFGIRFDVPSKSSPGR